MVLFGASFKKIALKFLCLFLKIKPTHLFVCFDFKHLKSSIMWNITANNIIQKGMCILQIILLFLYFNTFLAEIISCNI